jgi:hypothetical protein
VSRLHTLPGYTHTYPCHTHRTHTHTRPHTCARTHARTRTHTRTHNHTNAHTHTRKRFHRSVRTFAEHKKRALATGGIIWTQVGTKFKTKGCKAFQNYNCGTKTETQSTGPVPHPTASALISAFLCSTLVSGSRRSLSL